MMPYAAPACNPSKYETRQALTTTPTISPSALPAMTKDVWIMDRGEFYHMTEQGLPSQRMRACTPPSRMST